MTDVIYLLAYALLAADVLLTIRILADGGKELNPLMRWAMRKVGTKLSLVLTKLPIVAALLLIRDWRLPAAVCLMYSLVVGWNLYQRRQQH